MPRAREHIHGTGPGGLIAQLPENLHIPAQGSWVAGDVHHPLGSHGRHGGDEFIAILRPADGETIRKALDDVAGAVERYNGRDARVPISYAVGSASSADYPGEPMRTLLEKADTDMYEDKRLKHAAQENI